MGIMAKANGNYYNGLCKVRGLRRSVCSPL